MVSKAPVIFFTFFLSVAGLRSGQAPAAANNLPDGYYLKSVNFGHQDLLGKELDLTQGVAGELKITIREGSPEVGGTLKTDEKDHSDVMVVIAPEIAQ